MKSDQPFVLCAPFPGMDIPWSEEKKNEFMAVLDLYETDESAPAILSKKYLEYEMRLNRAISSVFIPLELARSFEKEFAKLSYPSNTKQFKTLVKSFDGRVI